MSNIPDKIETNTNIFTTNRKPEKYHFRINREEAEMIYNNWNIFNDSKYNADILCKELKWKTKNDWGYLTSNNLHNKAIDLDKLVKQWQKVEHDSRKGKVERINKNTINVSFDNEDVITEIDGLDLILQNNLIDYNSFVRNNKIPKELKNFELYFDKLSHLNESDIYNIEELISKIEIYDKTNIVDIKNSKIYNMDIDYDQDQQITIDNWKINETKELYKNKDNYYLSDYWTLYWVTHNIDWIEYTYEYDSINNEIIIKHGYNKELNSYIYLKDFTNEQIMSLKSSFIFNKWK